VETATLRSSQGHARDDDDDEVSSSVVIAHDSKLAGHSAKGFEDSANKYCRYLCVELVMVLLKSDSGHLCVNRLM